MEKELRQKRVNDDVLKEVIKKVIPVLHHEYMTSLEIADAIRTICESDVNQIANIMHDMGYEVTEWNDGLYWDLR